MKRPGHDVEPAIVECNDPSHQHNIAVMPKSGSFGFGSTNSWTAIGVCTFLVIVFACTTLYYWQKAQKMSKDLFTDNEGMYLVFTRVPIWNRVWPISGGRLRDNSLKYEWKTDMLYFILP